MKIIFFIILPILLYAQAPNCNVYLYNKDTMQYLACKSVEKVNFYQYTRQYQEKFDEAIEICPYFAYAYSAKSTAYLKSGDFISWKKLIDKAVSLDESYLHYRGWCRYQFFRDYNGAIEDIEYLESKIKTFKIGYSAGGEYHLIVAKAMCYSALNQKDKAISIMNTLYADSTYTMGLYDYYQLGVTYFQIKDYVNAEKYLTKQNGIYDIAENKYYLAKIAKIRGNIAQFADLRKEAISLYESKKYLFDPYTEHFNKIYLTTILEE